MPIFTRIQPRDKAQVRGAVNKANKRDTYLAIQNNPTLLFDINGHLITIDNTTYDEAIPTETIRLIQGQWRIVREYDEANIIQEQEVTITIPDEGSWSYVTLAAAQAANCLLLYSVPFCLEKCDENFWSFDLNLNPVVPNRLTGFAGEDRFVQQTATGRLTNGINFWIPNSESFVDFDTDIIYDESLVEDLCADCPICDRILNGWRTGTDGANLLIEYSEDSLINDFTAATLGSGVTDTYIGKTLWTTNDIVLAGTADTADPTTAANGQILYSLDGVNFQAARDDQGVVIDAPIHDIVGYGGRFLALSTGSYFTSSDGIVWCEIALSDVNEVLMEASSDVTTGIVYIAGAVGDGMGALTGGVAYALENGLLTDISGIVGGSAFVDLIAMPLYSVHAHENHTMFGGDEGSVFENFSAQDQGAYNRVFFTGSTGDLVVDFFDSKQEAFDLFTLSTGAVWRRSPLSAMNFRQQDLVTTLTGTPTNISTFYVDNDAFGFIDISYDDGTRLRLSDCRVSLCSDPSPCD